MRTASPRAGRSTRGAAAAVADIKHCRFLPHASQTPILAHLILATHQQGANKGTHTGKVFYALNCVFEENAAYEAIVKSVVYVKPKWFPEHWGSLAVSVLWQRL